MWFPPSWHVWCSDAAGGFPTPLPPHTTGERMVAFASLRVLPSLCLRASVVNLKELGFQIGFKGD